MESVLLDSRESLTLVLDNHMYKLRYPLARVAQLEEELGRPMRAWVNWLSIEPREIPTIVRIGLESDYGSVAAGIADDIAASASPEMLETLASALCAANWPEATRRYKEAVEAQKNGKSPNAGSAGVR